MLAVSYPQAFDSSEYSFEIKWDGYRCIAYRDASVRLLSRNGNCLNDQFQEIVTEVKNIPYPVVFDGELVMLNAEGKPCFSDLQHRKKDQMSNYIVFDLLFLQDRFLLKLPLTQRQNQLEQLINEQDFNRIILSRKVERRGIDFYNAIVEQDLEGMIAKKSNSVYAPGIRSNDWLKIKHRRKLDAVVVGYTPQKGGFKSLVLAQYLEDQLIYIGKVGTGFSCSAKTQLLKFMQKITASCPFLLEPKSLKDNIWIKPVITVAIEYLEFTNDGYLRQPSFLGISHKMPQECNYIIRRKSR